MKSLYGLKQAGRCWNLYFHDLLLECGLIQSQMDPCLYFNSEKTVFVLIWVDDIAIFADTDQSIHLIIEQLSNSITFEMRGQLELLLGMEVKFENDYVTFNQKQYIEKLIEIWKCDYYKSVHIPLESLIDQSINSEDCNENIFRKLPGSLQYLSNVSRPDIAFAVNYSAQFSTKPKMIHFKSLKRILCYLKETKEYSIKYSRKRNGETIHAFADANWANDKIDRKSVSEILVKLGYNDSPIIWKSSKQKMVLIFL